VTHLNVFGLLSERPSSREDLRDRLQLADRPAHVLVTALRAMGLLDVDARGRLTPSPVAAEHLGPGSPFDLSDYAGLAAASPGVLSMVERLRTNRPAGWDRPRAGTAFISRRGQPSAMEHPDLARLFTLALAGRSRSVAPIVAERLPVRNVRTILDVGGGTGLYSLALVRKHAGLRAIVIDRPEVLRVTEEIASQHGAADRIACLPGDMFVDRFPEAELILLSNVLHDWDVPECRRLIGRCAASLPPGGAVVIHDVFLRDELDGPLAVALHSAAIMSATEGRAYSARECAAWLGEAGLAVEGPIPTLAHSGLLIGSTPA
jgi:2-polyprenyl-3-methyl-5-hydroxy-6-metoxy-1,4-benzoquinol methylase